MPRELWKGAIPFGRVHIPVSLFPAEQRDELSFTMLDRRDLQPVGYKRFNKSTGDEVPYEETVKGFPRELDVPGDLKSAKVTSRELDMAERLVEDMAIDWDPAQYHDTYRDDLMKLIVLRRARRSPPALGANHRRRAPPNGAPPDTGNPP